MKSLHYYLKSGNWAEVGSFCVISQDFLTLRRTIFMKFLVAITDLIPVQRSRFSIVAGSLAFLSASTGTTFASDGHVGACHVGPTCTLSGQCIDQEEEFSLVQIGDDSIYFQDGENLIAIKFAGDSLIGTWDTDDTEFVIAFFEQTSILTRHDKKSGATSFASFECH